MTVIVLGLAPLFGCASRDEPVPLLSDSTRAELLALRRDHDYFRLRDRLERLGEPGGPWALLLQAVVATAFDRPARADSILALLDAGKAAVPDSVTFEAMGLRFRSDMRLFRYAEALADARQLMASPLSDSVSRADLRNLMRIWRALRETPPQTIESRRGATLRPKGGAVPIRIDSTERRYFFDSGANLSVLMRSQAEELGLQILPAGVEMGTATDLKVRADVAVADRVEVGGTVLRHVVFLVAPDSALTFPNGFRIPGIIGFPILSGLGALAYERDGTMRIPAEPEPTAGGTMALDSYTFFVPVTVHGDTLACQLDTGAGHTVFYNPYYRTHRRWIDSLGRPDTIKTGGVGGIRHLPVVRLPETRLTVAGTPVTLDSLDVYTRPIRTSTDDRVLCNLGRDALSGFEEYVLDFTHMALVLGSRIGRDDQEPEGRSVPRRRARAH
jgi:hypothetical protein